jgi:hypothetical protein
VGAWFGHQALLQQTRVGISIQVPGKELYLTDASSGQIRVGKQTLTMKHAGPKAIGNPRWRVHCRYTYFCVGTSVLITLFIGYLARLPILLNPRLERFLDRLNLHPMVRHLTLG